MEGEEPMEREEEEKGEHVEFYELGLAAASRRRVTKLKHNK